MGMYQFENDVKIYGIKTLIAKVNRAAGLRMM